MFTNLPFIRDNLVLTSVFAYFLGIPSLHAQDECHDVLSYGIWDTMDTSSDTINSQKVANWACNINSKSSGGDFHYGKTSFNINAGSSSSNNCSTSQHDYYLSESARTSIKAASQAIVTAWNNCMDAIGSH